MESLQFSAERSVPPRRLMKLGSENPTTTWSSPRKFVRFTGKGGRIKVDDSLTPSAERLVPPRSSMKLGSNNPTNSASSSRESVQCSRGGARFEVQHNSNPEVQASEWTAYERKKKQREEAARDAEDEAQGNALEVIRGLIKHYRGLIEKSKVGSAERARLEQVISDYEDTLKLLDIEEGPPEQGDIAKLGELDNAGLDRERRKTSLYLGPVTSQLVRREKELERVRKEPWWKWWKRNIAVKTYLKGEIQRHEREWKSLQKYRRLVIEEEKEARDQAKAVPMQLRKQGEDSHRKQSADRMSLQPGGSTVYTDVQGSPKSEASEAQRGAARSTSQPHRALRRVENNDPASANEQQSSQQRPRQQRPPRQQPPQQQSPGQQFSRQQPSHHEPIVQGLALQGLPHRSLPQQGLPPQGAVLPQPNNLRPPPIADESEQPTLRRVTKKLNGAEQSRKSRSRPSNTDHQAGGRR